MKRILDEKLRSGSSSTHTKRQVESPSVDELRSIYSRIHEKYSGSFSAFYKDLEKDADNGDERRTEEVRKPKLAGAR